MHSHSLFLYVYVCIAAGVYEAALLLLLPVFESQLMVVLMLHAVTMVCDFFRSQISKESNQPMTKG